MEDAVSQEQLAPSSAPAQAPSVDPGEGATTPPGPLEEVVVALSPHTSSTELDEAESYRYPNPGGNFYTGIDIASEVGGAEGRSFVIPLIYTGSCSEERS